MNNTLQPSTLYSIALNATTSLMNNEQVDYKKLYLPKPILKDISFKDLLNRSAYATATGTNIYSMKWHKSRYETVSKPDFCEIPVLVALYHGPATILNILDKYNIVTFADLSMKDYTMFTRANMTLIVFIQYLYNYALCETISEDIRKELSIYFIDAHNNLPPDIDTNREIEIENYISIGTLFSDILEGLLLLADENIELHPRLYILCIKNLIKLIVNKDKSILNLKNKFVFKKQIKRLLKYNKKLTVENFIDLCAQSKIKPELLKQNQELNGYF